MTRPTAHAAIGNLVEVREIVEMTRGERGRINEAPRIFVAVYGAVQFDESTTANQLPPDVGSDS